MSASAAYAYALVFSYVYAQGHQTGLPYNGDYQRWNLYVWNQQDLHYDISKVFQTWQGPFKILWFLSKILGREGGQHDQQYDKNKFVDSNHSK